MWLLHPALWSSIVSGFVCLCVVWFLAGYQCFCALSSISAPSFLPVSVCFDAWYSVSLALLVVVVGDYPRFIFFSTLYTLSFCRGELYWISSCSLVPLVQSEVHSAAEPPASQRDDSPMDVDQPSPLEQDQPTLGECLGIWDKLTIGTSLAWISPYESFNFILLRALFICELL